MVCADSPMKIYFYPHWLGQHVQQQVYVLASSSLSYYYVKRREAVNRAAQQQFSEMKREVFVHYRDFYESPGFMKPTEGKRNSFYAGCIKR